MICLWRRRETLSDYQQLITGSRTTIQFRPQQSNYVYGQFIISNQTLRKPEIELHETANKIAVHAVLVFHTFRFQIAGNRSAVVVQTDFSISAKRPLRLGS